MISSKTSSLIDTKITSSTTTGYANDFIYNIYTYDHDSNNYYFHYIHAV
eukprot:gene25166-14920_t